VLGRRGAEDALKRIKRLVIGQLALRFVIGGVVVSFFAAVAEILKPKTFAGLFAAAPSVAIATLGIAYVNRGGEYVAMEGRSMLVGNAALWRTAQRAWC